MSTLRLPPTENRNPWFRDSDGYWARAKLNDEVLNETIDFTHELGSAETLTAATWDDVSGPTITSTTVTTPSVTFTVTDSGDATLVVTTSDSRTLRRQLRWLASDSAPLSDYR